jgi:hypothetical protein
MTTTTRNEAAERLFSLVDELIPPSHRITRRNLQAAISGALAAERRATVERIRLRILDRVAEADDLSQIAKLHEAFAILDEEATR